MAAGRRDKPTLARRIEAARRHCGPDALLDQCRCRAAVLRAYAGMQASGAPDCVALEAAMRVYRYHHPQASSAHVQQTVETWVVRGTIH